MRTIAYCVLITLSPLVLICVRGRVNPMTILQLEGLGKSSDVVGNRTRDLLACSIVPQPTK
jgi:hypothetical protein